MCTHSKVKPLKCPFAGCAFETTSKIGLQGHLRVHKEDRLHSCPRAGCSFVSESKAALKRHLATHSRESLPSASEQSPMSTMQEKERPSLLMNPIQQRSSSDGCDSISTTSEDVEMHSFMQSTENLLKCPFRGCSFVATNYNSLRDHTFFHADEHV